MDSRTYPLQRFRDTNMLPPLRDAWDQPAFREPRLDADDWASVVPGT